MVNKWLVHILHRLGYESESRVCFVFGSDYTYICIVNI